MDKIERKNYSPPRTTLPTAKKNIQTKQMVSKAEQKEENHTTPVGTAPQARLRARKSVIRNYVKH